MHPHELRLGEVGGRLCQGRDRVPGGVDVAAPERELRQAGLPVQARAAGVPPARRWDGLRRAVPVTEVVPELRDRELQPVGRPPIVCVRGLEPLERSLECLLGSAGEVEHVGDVDPGAALLHLEALLASDLERLAQVGHAWIDVAALTEGRAERVQGDRLGLAVADRARHAERLTCALCRLGEARLHHPASRELGQELRALGARLVRQEGESLAQRLERIVLAVLAPERLADPLLD